MIVKHYRLKILAMYPHKEATQTINPINSLMCNFDEDIYDQDLLMYCIHLLLSRNALTFLLRLTSC